MAATRMNKPVKIARAAAFALSSHVTSPMAAQTEGPVRLTALRETIRLSQAGAPTLALQRQGNATGEADPGADVIYVHGATFGADLSVHYRFDGGSWADALNDAGFQVWGFDFAGYGASDRYPADNTAPRGRAGEALPQLERVVSFVRQRNAGQRVTLLAHSWGTVVAAQFAAAHPDQVARLILFGPIVTRRAGASAATAMTLASIYPLSAWAQYRRFIEDVPRGQQQVLSDADFQVWSAAYLATDAGADTRQPPSVLTPSGPLADIRASWLGQGLYDASAIKAPMLIVRGAWGSLCTDADAQTLLAALGSTTKEDAKIDQATHLMHLEAGRTELYRRVNAFLQRTSY